MQRGHLSGSFTPLLAPQAKALVHGKSRLPTSARTDVIVAPYAHTAFQLAYCFAPHFMQLHSLSTLRVHWRLRLHVVRMLIYQNSQRLAHQLPTFFGRLLYDLLKGRPWVHLVPVFQCLEQITRSMQELLAPLCSTCHMFAHLCSPSCCSLLILPAKLRCNPGQSLT